MKFATSKYNGLNVSFARCALGDTHQFRAAAPLPRADVATTQYWGGAFRYEKPDGSTLADMVRGSLGIDLPDFPEAGIYTLRAMEEGAQYFCVTPGGAKSSNKARIALAVGESYTLPQGRIAIVDDGADMRVVVAETSSAEIVGPCVGLEVWV